MFEDLDLDNDVFKVPWENPCPPEPPTKKLPSPGTKRQPVKRRFPGPAGIISNGPQSQPALNEVPCSQSSTQIFQGPWEQMSNDFRLLKDRGVYLPDKFNIAWIKAQVKNDLLINGKAPFLAGIIHKMNGEASVNSVVLKDPTGKSSVNEV
uniref:Uncharacterized protein n=1 Tax=Photinus pyralis TaxID=7054 RepID=A0A1Y1N4M7_PHOPY